MKPPPIWLFPILAIIYIYVMIDIHIQRMELEEGRQKLDSVNYVRDSLLTRILNADHKTDSLNHVIGFYNNKTKFYNNETQKWNSIADSLQQRLAELEARVWVIEFRDTISMEVFKKAFYVEKEMGDFVKNHPRLRMFSYEASMMSVYKRQQDHYYRID